MDTTEKILKLAALGWTGNEPELDFFSRVYNLDVRTEESSLSVIIRFRSKRTIRVRGTKKLPDPVECCLCVFRTDDGVISGPDPYLIHYVNEEWT